MAASLGNGQPEKPQYSKQFTGFCLCLNIGLSIGIVMINKYIYTTYGFPNITMTCIHFICTTIGMLICKCTGIFTPKSLPIGKMLPISLTFCGFVVFTNLSLQTNTVGTYQIMKCLTTPCIMVIQTYFYSRSFSTNVRLTLVSSHYTGGGSRIFPGSGAESVTAAFWKFCVCQNESIDTPRSSTVPLCCSVGLKVFKGVRN